MNKKHPLYINFLLSFSIITTLLIYPSSVGFASGSRSSPRNSSSHSYNDVSRVSDNNLTINEFALQESTTFTVTQTVEPPNGYKRPVIVVNTYSVSQDTISPGDSFTLFVTLYNAGQHYAMNIVANFTAGDLIPRETGGVVAVGEIAPGNHSEF